MASSLPPYEASRLVNGFRIFQMLAAACELKIPDLVAAGPQGPAELAAATGAHQGALHRLLRGLAAWGVVDETSPGRFAGTPLSEAFRSDRPGLRDMTLMFSGDVYQAWGHLRHTLLTGEPAYPNVFGKTHFEALGEDTQAGAKFNAAMVESTSRVASAFVAAFDFTGVRTVVDVGSGSGALLAAVLSAHKEIRGVLFDLPQGLRGAAEKMAAAGVAGRASLVEGDFFESVPPGGDLYLLKWIVHDWDDERAVELLKACRRAMAPGARLVLLERHLAETADGSPEAFDATMADLQMMVVLGGRERTNSEYAELLARSGFNVKAFLRIDSAFGAIEAAPAEKG